MMIKKKSQNFRTTLPKNIAAGRSLHQTSKHFKTETEKKELLSTIMKNMRPNIMDEVESEGEKLRENQLVRDLERSFDASQYERDSRHKENIYKRFDASNSSQTQTTMERQYSTVSSHVEPQTSSALRTIGDEAVFNYFAHYKQLNRIRDQDSSSAVKPSVFTEMLSRCESLGILPSKLGVVKYKGQSEEVRLENGRYGDKYIEAMTEGIKQMNIKSCHLNANRITHHSAKFLLPSLTKNLQTLKLNNNQIGAKGIDYFHKLLQEGSKLHELDLSNNRLSDIGVIKLCTTLQGHSRIKILNISRNGVTCKCSAAIASLITNNQFEELYLQWNQIQAPGGKQILQALIPNSSIKVFDFSWNLIGTSRSQSTTPALLSKTAVPPVSTADLLCRLIKENSELIHVDFSSNGFGKQDCIKISEALKSMVIIEDSNNCGPLTVQSRPVTCKRQQTGQSTPNQEELSSPQTTHTRFKSNIVSDSKRTLKDKNKLIGFHFKGNFGYMDTMGLLVLTDDMKARDYRESLAVKNIDGCIPTNTFYKSSKDKSLSNKNNYLKPTQSSNSMEVYVARDVCWICQGWIEHTFVLNLDQTRLIQSQNTSRNQPSAPAVTRYVWIHFSFEDFKGRYVGSIQSQNQIKYLCMVPPKGFQFFFTVNYEQVVSSNYSRVSEYDHNYFKALEVGTELLQCYVEDRNIWEDVTPRVIIDQNYQPLCHSRPRFLPGQAPPHVNSKVINPSNSQDLVYAGPAQTAEQLTEEFTRDWSYLKVNHLMSNQQIFKVKAVLYQHYPLVKELYRYYSCFNETSTNEYFIDAFALGRFLKDFEEIIFNPEVENNKLTKEVILFQLKNVINSSNKAWEDNQNIPRTGVVRFRLIELLIRMMPHRFEPSSIVYSQGLREILLAIKSSEKYSQQVQECPKWIDEFYKPIKATSQSSDLSKTTTSAMVPLDAESILRKFRNSLQRVFVKHCSSKWKVGEKKFLLFEDFKHIISSRSGATLSSKDMVLKTCFYYSKAGPQDYYYDNSFNRLYFAQFLQALARYAWVELKNSIGVSSQTAGSDQVGKQVRVVVSDVHRDKYLMKLENLLRNVIQQ